MYVMREGDGEFIITMKWAVNKSHRFVFEEMNQKIDSNHSFMPFSVKITPDFVVYTRIKSPVSISSIKGFKIQPHTILQIYWNIGVFWRMYSTSLIDHVYYHLHLFKILLHLSCAQIVDLVWFNSLSIIQVDFFSISYLGLFSVFGIQ